MSEPIFTPGRAGEGGSLSYWEAGAGETVVAVVGDGERPTPAYALLAEHRRILVFAVAADGGAPQQEAGRVGAVVAGLGIERFDLLGEGAGAAAALWLALDPEVEIGAIVLAAPDGTPDDAFRDIKQPALVLAGTEAGSDAGDRYRAVLPDAHLFGPHRSGYDSFWGIRSGAVDYYSHYDSRGRHDLWDGDEEITVSGYLTDLLGDRAVAIVNDHAKSRQPFLLSLHFNAPHWPWEAPGDDAESARIAGKLRHHDGGTQRTYARMVEAMDLQVGRVLQALDAGGLAGNTIVVFTSDNGGERFSATWPFTGIKTELLEGGLRVPGLVCWPDRIPAGRVSEQVMITMDWFPTLLAAAGVGPDPEYPPDGIDLMPVLSGAGQPQPRKLFWRYKVNRQRALREGDFKYLKIRDNTYLFNVVDDPRERANLKERRPELFARLAAEWEAWNATMLPEIPDSFGEAFTAANYPDHIGS